MYVWDYTKTRVDIFLPPPRFSVIPIHTSLSAWHLSANYRGISLSTSLSKILDIVILERYKSTLCTSDLQFAFKVGHSTSMCTFVLREVVNYFVQRNTPVYCCLLDASKAFDRLRFDKLFSTLLERRRSRGKLPVLDHLMVEPFP